MGYLTLVNKTQQGLYFGHSQIMGATKTLHSKGTITECTLPKYHEFVASLEKDELGKPILPDLGITTVQVEDQSKLAESIHTYLEKNGDDTITELIFDLENQTFSVDQEAKNKRLKKQIFSQHQDRRNSEIRAAQDRIDQNAREKRMGKTPSLTDEQIAELDNYIQEWVDFKDSIDPENPVVPQRPDFL